MVEMTPLSGIRLRSAFVDQINVVAAENAWDCSWISDYWVCDLSSSGRRQRVVGGWFALNDSASVQLVADKSASAAIFDAHRLASIRHQLLRPQGRSVGECARQVLGRWNLPIVLKPNLGAAGEDVFRCFSAQSVVGALGVLVNRYSSIAVCGYVDIEDETRYVVLDDRVLFGFRKLRSDAVCGEWRHNLRFGAIPHLLEVHESDAELLALDATAAARLRFATVDVVRVAGCPKILEVSGSVRLESFSRRSDVYWDLARDAFEQALTVGFEPRAT